MVTSVLPLRLNNVSVTKHGKTLVGPIDLELGMTGITVILGPNGSGKTTLLRLIHGLERPRHGEVVWNVPTSEARQRQAFVFQTPIMLRRSALENVAYPLHLQNMAKDAANLSALRALESVDLENSKHINAGYLSGGEKQKLAIARALAIKPDILFLDEPTASLDSSSMREIETIIKSAVASGIRIVMTTHDIGQGKRLADDVCFLFKGVLHEQSSAKSFFEAPKTKEAQFFLAGEIVE
ncbi:MAG: ATP-binding cassette domain-containing protein [Pseudomonadota bacterium]